MSGRIRVGIVVGQLHRGGTERQAYELATRLHPGRCEVVVYCLSSHVEPFGPMLTAAGVPLRVLPRKKSYEAGRLLSLSRLFSSDRPDVVHSAGDSPNLYSCLALLLAGRRPFLASNRATDSTLPWIAARVNRMVLGGSDRVVVNSLAGAAFTRSFYRVPAEKIEVIPNGLDTGRFASLPDPSAIRSSLGIPAGAPVLGFAGRFSPEKRPRFFLEACARIAGRLPDARYLMVGDGPGLPEARRQAVEGGLGDRVFFTGFRDDTPGLLAAMDLLAVTSSQEGLPNIILEAMAAGRPVVATDVGGCRELIIEGITGHLAEAGDPGSLAEKALRILSLPDRGRALGEAGRRRVSAEFSVEAMVGRFEELYHRLHRPPSSPPGAPAPTPSRGDS